jgi:hypothetical protein
MHRCTWAERSVDQWTIASTRKGAFYLAKCAGSRVNCALLHHVTFVMLFSVGRSIMQEKKWVPLGLALNWDNIISKSIWCYCILQLSSLHISFSNCQSLSACAWYFSYMFSKPASVHLNSYNTCDMLVSPNSMGMGLHWPGIRWHASRNSRNLLQLVMQLVPVGRGWEGRGGDGV